MRKFHKVAIIGTGLIGGSLALAIKKKRLADQIVGVSRHKKNLAIAKKKGAIDQGSQHLDIIRGADLVVLAVPVSAIINLASEIRKLISKGCIVIDVGSTKKQIVSCLEKIFPNYVGTHPLAGSEKRSILHAHPDLFNNSLCILTPTKKTTPKILNKIKMLWGEAGAKVALMAPETHDKILSFVSHLPHIAAFSLIGAVPGQHLKFASGGLRDATRIAASDSELWVDIFFSNQKNILEAIKSLEGNLTKIKSAIKRKDRKTLSAILKKAKGKRESLG